MAQEQTGRIGWIDLAKGAGILLVAVGHLTNGAGQGVWLPALDSMHYALYLFHMPLFFILGGMVLDPHGRTLGEFAVSRARGLLVSYYVFSLYFLAKPLALVAFPGLASSFGLDADGADVAGTLWNVLVRGEGLWFLWACFWAQVIAFVLLSLLGKVGDRTGELPRRVFVVLLGCMLVVLSQAWHIMHFGQDPPFQLLRGVWGAGYVLIGNALAPTDVLVPRVGGEEKHLSATARRVISLAVGVVAMVAFVRLDLTLRGSREPAFWGAIIYDGTQGITSGKMSLAAALLGSLAVVLFSRAWERCEPLEAVGRESLAYYALSPLVMNACKLLLFSVLGVSLVEAPAAAQLACGLALSLASVALTAPLVRLIGTHAPWLFGRAS